jgi:hypothetical protein
MALYPSPRISAVSPEISSPRLNPELWRRYQTIINNSRYSHFTRIPERIVRFLDSFPVDFNREAVYERLLSHYLFIAVVDDAIDSGKADVAHNVFERFSGVARALNEVSRRSDVAVVTAILKSHLEGDMRLPILRSLQRAHREVTRERAAKSVGMYIRHRKALGRATARQSYLLIRSALREPSQKLCRLMEEIGAVGCLVDSVIDVREDQRADLLNFDLTVVTYARLCFTTAVAGLRVLAKKPSLIFLFGEAVLDNIRDRDRARAIPPAASSLQHSAQSFRDSVAHRL